jgi:hypothetical protein
VPDAYLDAVALPDVDVGTVPASLRSETIEAIDGVRAAGTYVMPAAFPASADPSEFYPLGAPTDAHSGATFLSEPLVRGRRPDASRPDEVALGETTAKKLGVDVGDTLDLLTFTQAQVEDVQSSTENVPEGPPIALQVVGILRQPADLGGRAADVTFTELTPAFWPRYQAEVGALDHMAMVTLEPDEAVSAFADDMAPLAPDANYDTLLTAARVASDLRPSVGVITTGLWAIALAVAFSGLVTVGQALGRTAQATQRDDDTLRAVGLTRAERAVRAGGPGALAAAIGVALGAVVAVAASPLLPVGIARRADPSHGFTVDWVVLGVGSAVALLAVGVITAITAAAATRPHQVRHSTRPSLADHVAAAGAPPSVTTGLALARGRGGREPAPARSAGTAAVAAVVGVVAATIFAASATHLLRTPALYGWGWDVAITGTETDDLPDDALEPDRYLADADIAAAATVSVDLTVRVDDQPLGATVIRPLKGDPRLVLLDGRQLGGATDAVVGPTTLRALHAGIGDQVEVALRDQHASFEIVGEAIFPTRSDGGASSEGFAISGAGADRLGFGGCDEETECADNVALTLADPGAMDAVRARYTDDAGSIGVRVPDPPNQVARLRTVDWVPWLLAGFLVVVAAVTVTHAIATAVRRRRHEFAVLRSLGFDRRQLRSVVGTQVVALVAVSCTVGVVLGVVAGRVLWRAVTDAVDLPPFVRIPPAALVGVPLAVLLLAEVASIAPRRAVARLPAAEVLRTE